MGLIPIKDEDLSKLNEFKYKSKNNSIVYNKCLSPCLNEVVEFLPKRLAPNVLTILSVIMNTIAALYTYNYAGFEFNVPLKKTHCLTIGITQLLYLLLDNLDGKQARRTNSSSPFGMLLDHGCDVFTNIFTAYNISHILILSNSGITSLTIFLGLFTGFYIMTYEEYCLEIIIFPMINGANEGNVAVSLISILLGLTDPLIMGKKIFGQITIGIIIGYSILICSFFSLFNLFYHTYKEKGTSRALSLLLELKFYYVYFLYPIIYAYFKKESYDELWWLVIIITSLLFARATLELQLAVATISKVKYDLYFYLVNSLVIISLFIPKGNFSFYYLLAIFNILTFEIICFIVLRGWQILDYLGLRLLFLPTEVMALPNDEKVSINVEVVGK